jgi:mannan endo-1,4-beta-mannosidase
MKKVLLLSLVTFCLFSCGNKQATEETLTPVRPLVDANATPETVALYNRLDALLNKGIMLGHQDDLLYGNAGGGWYNEPGRSDVKESTGKLPAVFGYEIGHVELGDKPYTLDSIFFDNLKRSIYDVNKMGGISTISWHVNNPVTDGGSWDCSGDGIVTSILPGGENHEKYQVWMGRLADFFLDLKDDNGKLIPVIFRAYHEHTGSWFWWGRNHCTPEEYNKLYQMTVEYLRDTRNVHNVLYAFSPTAIQTEAEYLERFPGYEYVDIIGFDCYANNEGDVYIEEKAAESIANYKHTMKTNLDIVVDLAAKAGKIPTISETGMEAFSNPRYFTELSDAIKDYNVSYVLLWRNAYDRKGHYYAGYPGCPNEADFQAFVKQPRILTLDDIK